MNVLEFTTMAMNILAPGLDHSVMSQAMTTVIESEPPIFHDDSYKLRTASLIVAVAYREGTFGLSVIGDCDNSKPGECKGKPHSFCTMQINEVMGGGPQLNEDPVSCIRLGHRLLRMSAKSCPSSPVAWYASGPQGCGNNRAQKISKDRMNLAHWVWTKREKEVN